MLILKGQGGRGGIAYKVTSAARCPGPPTVGNQQTTRANVGTALILYDGVCGLCNRGVRFVLRRDRNSGFRFAALQSSTARKILAQHGIEPDALDTFYVLPDFGMSSERVLSRSAAALYIAAKLGGVWKLAAVLGILPETSPRFSLQHHCRESLPHLRTV